MSVAASEMSAVRLLDRCPACGCAIASCRPLFPVNVLGQPGFMRRCSACSVAFKDVFPTEKGLREIYGSHYVHFQPGGDADVADRHTIAAKLKRCMRLAKRAAQPLRILDVGCGGGQVVRIAREAGFDAIGIDPNLPEELQGAALMRATLADVQSGSFDVVLLLNVMEHSVAPHELARSAWRVLRPGGVLLITCPYGQSLALRWFGSRWIHSSLQEHLTFWTPASLRRLLESEGFAGPRAVRIGGSPFPFGRTAERQPSSTPAKGDARDVASPARRRLQSSAWSLARRIQRSRLAAAAVRLLVHATRTGDYLEVAVQKTAS